MRIAYSAGISRNEQGVAAGMASTALNVGNAIGLAILIAVANSGVRGRSGELLLEAISSGERTAF